MAEERRGGLKGAKVDRGKELKRGGKGRRGGRIELGRSRGEGAEEAGGGQELGGGSWGREGGREALFLKDVGSTGMRGSRPWVECSAHPLHRWTRFLNSVGETRPQAAILALKSCAVTRSTLDITT